jgi:hypothetical protein
MWVQSKPLSYCRKWKNNGIIGVYILMNKQDECIYVGHSFNILTRLNTHRSNGVDYDYALCYEIEQPYNGYVYKVEKKLTRILQPKLNKNNK